MSDRWAGSEGGWRKGGSTLRERSLWMRLPSRARAAILVFVLCILVYAVLLRFVPRYEGVPTTNGDEPHYLITVESLVYDGDLYIENNYDQERYLDYYEPGGLMMHPAKGPEGRAVPGHPIFLSLLLLPGFWLFGYKGAAMTMAASMAAAAAFTFLVCDRFVSRKIALVVILFVFFTYPMLFYSRLLYPETVSVLMITLAIWSALRLKETEKVFYAAIGGLFSGLPILLHFKFGAMSLALFFLFWITTPHRKGRYLAAWLVPLGACVALFFGIAFITFGGRWVKGITATGEGKLLSGMLGENSFWGVLGMYLDRAWGLFIFAPLYLLFPHGLSLQNNRLEWRRWWVFFVVCVVLHTLLLGVFQYWHAGTAPVNRYLVPLVPLFAICIALFLDRCRSKTAWVAALLLAGLQVLSTACAFRYMVGTYGIHTQNQFLPYFLNESWLKKTVLFVFPLYHPTNAGAILTTIVWIALFAATVYAARRYYLKHDGGKLSPLVDIGPFERLKSPRAMP